MGMNKKGYVGDVLMWGILLVSMILVVTLLYNLISAAADSVPTDQPIVKSSLSQDTIGWAKAWDFAIVAGIGFMFLASLTSAWLVGTDNTFFWITLILLIMFLLALVVLNNIAYAFFANEAFLVVREEMPGTNFIINNLFEICIGGAGLLLLVFFSKGRQ